MFEPLARALKRRRRSLSPADAKANGRRVIWTLLLPSLMLGPCHYIWAQPPGQTQHLAVQGPNRRPEKRRCQGLGVINIGGTKSGSRGFGAAAQCDRKGSQETLGGRSHLGRASGLDERTHAFAKVVLTDVQGGDEANDLIVEPAGDQKDIALQRCRDRSLRDQLLVELCRHHRAEAADLAETRMRAQGSELFDHDLADPP